MLNPLQNVPTAHCCTRAADAEYQQIGCHGNNRKPMRNEPDVEPIVAVDTDE